MNYSPDLKKATITPVADGHLDGPLYDTPMIRAFPNVFSYSIPCSWPSEPYDKFSAFTYPWLEYGEQLRERYHGFRIARRVLAKEDNSVIDFIANKLAIDFIREFLLRARQSHRDIETLRFSPSRS